MSGNADVCNNVHAMEDARGGVARRCASDGLINFRDKTVSFDQIYSILLARRVL
jgi:hypothetical protein